MGVQKGQQYIYYMRHQCIGVGLLKVNSRPEVGGEEYPVRYVIRIVFLQKPLRTTKSSHPLDCTCRKVFSTSNGHVQYINDDHWFF